MHETSFLKPLRMKCGFSIAHVSLSDPQGVGQMTKLLLSEEAETTNSSLSPAKQIDLENTVRVLNSLLVNDTFFVLGTS